MAVTLNANTSTGFIATSDTSGVLQLQTGGTTAVTISSGQVATFAQAPVLPAASIPQAALASNVAGNGPVFSASMSANQTFSAATFTRVNFDTASSWGSATNSWDGTNKRFTAPVSGYYLFTGCLYSTGAGWGNQTLTIARINNSDDIRLQDTASTTYNLQINGMVYLSSGQYLDFYIYATVGGTFNASSSLTWMRGTLMRAA